MSDDPMTPLRAAYVTQRQRAFASGTRGIASPEQRRAWEDEANGLIAAHDREVKAEALRVASAQCSNVAFGSNADVAEWLLDRADPTTVV